MQDKAHVIKTRHGVMTQLYCLEARLIAQGKGSMFRPSKIKTRLVIDLAPVLKNQAQISE